MRCSIKKFTRLTSVMLFSILLMGFDKANISKSKTLVEKVSVNADTYFKVKNNCGPIEFRSTTGSEATIEATLLVEGELDTEIQKVIDQFELLVSDSGNHVDVIGEDNVKNWVRVNGWFTNKNTITFEDGTKANDITEMDLGLVVYLPQISELSIYNKYDDVTFDSFNCNVNAEMFSSDFRGGDINGDLDINLKYGDVNVGNVQNADLQYFDCDSNIKNAKDVNVNVKYSDLEFQNVDNFVVVSFDDELKIGNIANELKVDAKYSEISTGNFTEADFEFFDCDTRVGNGEKLEIDSKYGDHTIGNVSSVNVSLFQDEFSVGNVKNVDAKNTKYSTLKFDLVDESFKAISSFQDDINVGSVGASVQAVELDSKYTDFDFPIPSSVSYHLNADLEYCNFSFPDSCSNGSKDNGDRSYNIDCQVSNPGSTSLTVKLNAFDGDIDIK